MNSLGPSPNNSIEKISQSFQLAPPINEESLENLEDNNDTPQQTNKVNKINDVRKKITVYGNLTSLGLNMLTGVSELLFPKGSKLFQVGKKLGDIGYRAFLLINGNFGLIDGLKKNDYLYAFSNAIDNYVALETPREMAYLVRGTLVGGLNAALSLTQLLKVKSGYKGFMDHFSSIFKGFKEFGKQLTGNFKNSIISSESGVLTMVSSILSLLGPAVWKLTGSEKAGALLRNLGGSLIDIEYLKPGNLKQGRVFYWLSGLGFAVGTIADTLARFIPKYKDLFVTANILFDSLARVFQNESGNRGELLSDFKAKATQIKDIPGIVFNTFFGKAQPGAA